MGFFKSIGNFLKGAAGSLLGAGISSGAGYAGGRKADQAAAAINAANIASQERINAENLRFQAHWARRNEAEQRRFAKMGIRWKVQDAKRAGLHPLYAIGSSTSSYSPVSVVGSSVAPRADYIPSAKGQALAQMGQNIAGAIGSTLTPEEQERHRAELRLIEAQTDLTHQQAAASARASFNQRVGPGIPLPGYSTRSPRAIPLNDYDAVKHKAAEVTSVEAGKPHIRAGAHGAFQRYNFGGGVNMLVPYSDEGPMNALEEMPLYLVPLWVRANVDEYGDKFNIGLASSVSRLSRSVINDLVNAYRRGDDMNQVLLRK